jgi:hypothetical protein
MPNFIGFLSGVLLIGVALVLPVCIVGSVARAIAATRHQDQPTR